ncbi:LppU/SCO3897 family protein [Streptomyces sp. NPDC001348]
MTTPPPQGQAPYPPQPGFPQQGQAPYPPQPGFPQQATAPYAPVPPTPKRKMSFRTIRTIVVILLAAGGALYGYISSQDDANTAKVGDCMHRGNSSDTNPDLEVVDCGSAKAQYVVLAKIKGLYATDVMASNKCRSEAKDFKYTYTESGDGKDFLLCLKDK